MAYDLQWKDQFYDREERCDEKQESINEIEFILDQILNRAMVGLRTDGGGYHSVMMVNGRCEYNVTLDDDREYDCDEERKNRCVNLTKLLADTRNLTNLLAEARNFTKPVAEDYYQKATGQKITVLNFYLRHDLRTRLLACTIENKVNNYTPGTADNTYMDVWWTCADGKQCFMRINFYTDGKRDIAKSNGVTYEELKQNKNMQIAGKFLFQLDDLVGKLNKCVSTKLNDVDTVISMGTESRLHP